MPDFPDVEVTPTEDALLCAVHYGITVPPGDLPSFAAGEDCSGGRATEAECRVALDACLAKGWLQVIDEPALARITHELHEGRFIGPIYGFPSIGGVDFTRAGAECWQSLCRRRCPGSHPFAYTDVVHSKTAHYFRTRAAALQGIEEARAWPGDITVVGPSRIGPWRAKWWLRFPEGYRIDVEEKRQWQGRGANGEGCSTLPLQPQRNVAQRLQHVLDRHNVTYPEWLLLQAMDGGSCKSAYRLPGSAAWSAQDDFGVTASEEECRAGLDACLRYGWLRIVDEGALHEIEALLGSEPAIMVTAGNIGQLGDIDFTPRGAALYRMLVGDWLGPDWEDDVTAWKESFREEHYYCESEDGLPGRGQDRAVLCEAVRASRVVPIGPWCVWWWEQFPKGYRLELKIGEP
jgi:hypothetical protein